jgi:tetratricopeptide (TPR) repeat protein
VLAQVPNFPRARMIASAYLEKGQFAEALRTIDGWDDAPGSLWTVANEARVLSRMGQTARARSAVEKLLRSNSARSLNPWLLIIAYLGVGQFDAVFEQLDRAYQVHSPSITALKVDPIYDPVRRDPRYASLLRRVGLAE